MRNREYQSVEDIFVKTVKTWALARRGKVNVNIALVLFREPKGKVEVS